MSERTLTIFCSTMVLVCAVSCWLALASFDHMKAGEAVYGWVFVAGAINMCVSAWAALLALRSA